MGRPSHLQYGIGMNDTQGSHVHNGAQNAAADPNMVEINLNEDEYDYKGGAGGAHLGDYRRNHMH
jgi:hypothetical protein